ncbi:MULTISPECIES: type II toxin-antitoxin system RelE/ParE family toxin [unclassified Oceanispirochaeta]|uniref:type II toxin-antitoxin system RelE/ParE family toxin n=1 Tax=unclassified Oceanispirochaeta TaxID=2635722 RepID=UPI000E09A2B9|nr:MULTISPECIES: type II toxin-antitoxin system RelE/ParE family toxin [unclassified Oceanispirochaeta]MBF9018407.1 type II toxin-antitoxin system RelE/ParE family toxin [Oceanispirochaeta sp. M2]NPD75219.1 plasmid stabilization protein [Oceanispirochaeta sp. M1]RDG28936.1 plasmid stabilization protein [Oceanispirochaeta sp. M1]
MPKIIFTESYEKSVSKFIKKHPKLINQYSKTLQLLELNPNHPSLRLHRLKGNLSELHSVSINMTYRITIEFIIQEDQIIPIHVGTHDEAYK